MKKFVALLLVAVLSCAFVLTAAASDYSFLDGMTLEEMIALQSELETRISDAKNAAGASDPTNTGIWEVRYYVDGTFSNSATTNSELYVIWLIDKSDVAIKLVEYGRSVVKSSYSSTNYNIVMLDPDGNRVYMTGTMWKGGDRIYIDSEYESTVIEALKRNGSVSFRIDEGGKYGNSSYLFKMEDTSFFDNAYSMLK